MKSLSDYRELVGNKVTGEIHQGAKAARVSDLDVFHFLSAADSWLLIPFPGDRTCHPHLPEADSLAAAGESIAEGRDILGVNDG